MVYLLLSCISQSKRLSPA